VGADLALSAGYARTVRRIALAMISFASACATDEGVPEGKLARVGEVVLGPDDLAGVQAQLGAYAQLRFRGEEGRASLLEALVTAELLAQEAIAAGLGDDPRVHWAVLEEVATLARNAEFERRVPYADVAADGTALRAYYDAHPDELVVAEQRRAEGVLVATWAEAERALAQLQAGSELAALGEVVTTPLQVRDDAEYPAFHRVLFDRALAAGDPLPQPVMVGERLLVGRVREVVAPARVPFDDAVAQEQLVQAVRAPLLERAERELEAELAARWPEAPPPAAARR
jgi:hypothetical protein